VTRRTPAGWKVVDVLADGSISRVATERSDFRGPPSSGGGEALLVSLQRKTLDLSGGALAQRGSTPSGQQKLAASSMPEPGSPAGRSDGSELDQLLG
jgi:hypothetical protein